MRHILSLHKPLRPSDHIKKANDHFEKMGCDATKSKHENEKGKSKRIASGWVPTTIFFAHLRRKEHV
jgi:hypothetical protein